MSSALESLRSLRDVDGIVGSFVLSEEGALLLRDLPSVFDRAALAEVGPRVSRLREALSNDGVSPSVVVRYDDHKLILRSLPEMSLIVLTEHTVNMTQLKMALNLVGKMLIKSDLLEAGSLPEIEVEVPTPSAPPVAVPRSSAVPARPAQVFYRGRRVP